MPAIKIHLDEEEFAPILRLAADLRVTPEDVAYAALNRLMLGCQDGDTRNDITQTHNWRGSNLPAWSDSARSVHAYEGRADEHSIRHV
jgi:hypothetical protein